MKYQSSPLETDILFQLYDKNQIKINSFMIKKKIKYKLLFNYKTSAGALSSLQVYIIPTQSPPSYFLSARRVQKRSSKICTLRIRARTSNKSIVICTLAQIYQLSPTLNLDASQTKPLWQLELLLVLALKMHIHNQIIVQKAFYISLTKSYKFT